MPDTRIGSRLCVCVNNGPLCLKKLEIKEKLIQSNEAEFNNSRIPAN